jgi:predicted regulator of Ras-like GTPase activity (Roadblock/LC7/MglB family)
MTPALLAWVLSGLGAMLFFAAGVLFALSRGTRPVVPQAEVVPPRLEEEGFATGDILRQLLDRETQGSRLAGAVIADELGLVVASTGEHGDALAAYGAALVGLGAKTREALPLTQLRQVTVQDDRDMTLTVRPIAAAQDHFALVTLAAGQPEGAPASAAQRS